MFKLMIVGRRRGGMTLAQLHLYMLERHGAMVLRHIARHPALTPQRYVQNHVFDASTRVPPLCAPDDPFASPRDFVTQVWFDDPAQARAAVEAPFYRDELQPDEDRFVDQPGVRKLPVAEVQALGTAAPRGRGKLFVFHRAAPGVLADEVLAASSADWTDWLTGDSARVERLVRHRVLGPPDEVPVDVIDEAWLRDDAAVVALAEHWQHCCEREPLASRLVPGSTVVLLAHEHVLFAGAGAPA